MIVFDILEENLLNNVSIKGLSPNTLRKYNESCMQFLSFCTKTNIYNLKYLTMETVINFLKINDHKSVSTRNLYIASISNLLNFLCFKYKIHCRIKLSSLKRATTLPIYFPEEEIITLLDNLKNDRYSCLCYRNFAMIYVLYSTGVRVSELMQMKLSDFNFLNDMLYIKGIKSSDRYVPYAKDTIKYILEYTEICGFENSNSSLWLNPKNKKVLQKNTVQKIIKNITGSYPHKIRHSYATHMYQKGCDIFVLSQIMGHKDISTTSIYTHLSDNYLKSVIKKYHPIRNFKF